MPIKGSFSDSSGFDPKVIEAMCIDTASESGKELEKAVVKRTPVDTGELAASIHSSELKKPYPNHYKVDVQTDLNYARPIEYGFGPFRITPNTKEALLFNGRFSEYANHPGYAGAHMFARASAWFEQARAEQIAKKNVKKYLH
jgi:hypothetical protein